MNPNFDEAIIDYFITNFKHRDDDIVVPTFPKSGTTWTLQILHLLRNRGEQGNVSLNLSCPWPEAELCKTKFPDSYLRQLDQCPQRRILKTHSPVRLYNTQNPNVKYVVVLRNPKDTMVSLFYHQKSKGPTYNGDWNTFYQIFLAGGAEGGDWFDHTREWWEFAHRHPDRALLLKYEDMIRDHRGAIRKLADFAGFECDEALVDAVQQKSSFRSMKANPLADHHHVKQVGEKHLRKGEIGDWRNHFSIAQSEEFDKIFAERNKTFKPPMKFDYQ
eukprot:CAMPEP_0113935540 /NCGR_PEP_ID=MMETSP1339-20121228/2687_1 /TAXON_ID=94617 /ORGANISM="Fibrocapsa japonica" /LENGTH=273 /DNA_ID=CAMNT_0000937741 /DNA_START=300 /DNA_END=1121 /DNA_ORIENTATION=+ /assembly_acc=CAM_ASM_000762